MSQTVEEVIKLLGFWGNNLQFDVFEQDCFRRYYAVSLSESFFAHELC